MNFGSNYDPQTGRGEEPWWSYAKSLDLADVGKLPAYAYSKLPLPGSELASGIAGGWEQPEYPRGSYNNPQTGAFDPSRYIPRTTAERQTRIPSAEEQNVRPYERFPQLDVAMAAMPLARPAANLGRQAGRQFAYDMFESPIAEAGAIRPVRRSGYNVLEYYKPDKPEQTLGHLAYSKKTGEAPLFEYIESNTPRGTGELLDALQKRLGPMLDQMELTNILPNAVPFWQKLAGSKRLDAYPNLRQRILNNATNTSKEYEGLIPKNSYANNPVKTGEWIEREIVPDADWNVNFNLRDPGDPSPSRLSQSVTARGDELATAWNNITEGMDRAQRMRIINDYDRGAIPNYIELSRYFPAGSPELERAMDYLRMFHGGE